MVPPTDTVAILSDKLYDIHRLKSLYNAFLMCPHRAGEMAPWLKVCTAFKDNPSSVLSTQVGGSQPFVNSSLRDPMPPFWPTGVLHS